MRSDRLLKLADFLETVPKKAFTISAWEARAATKPEGRVPGECGFAGCAVGWAAHSKMFRGFYLSGYVLPFPHYKRPGKSLVQGDSAICALFDITANATGDLFYPRSYDGRPTPKQVAKRIRKFVADHKGAK